MAQLTMEMADLDLRDIVTERAANILAHELESEIGTEVRQRVRGAIDDRINEIVSGVLEKEFQPVDIFGDKIGTPTSIKEIITEKAKAFMCEKVDANGRTDNSYHAKTTRAQYLFGEMLKQAINFAAEKEIKAIAEQAKQGAHKKVAQLLVDTLQKC